MDAHRILVTAGTGVQGTGVVEHCLQAGHTVHALVRNAASEAAQNLQRKGVFLVQGDYDNLDVLKQACQNVDAVFLNVVPVMHDPDQEVLWAQNVITASKSSGKVSHFYYSSVAMTGQHESFPGWGPHHPQYGYWISKNRIEGLVRDAGFPHWTILRPAFFMQNFYGPHTTYMFQDIAEKHVFRTAIEKETRLALVDGSESENSLLRPFVNRVSLIIRRSRWLVKSLRHQKLRPPSDVFTAAVSVLSTLAVKNLRHALPTLLLQHKSGSIRLATKSILRVCKSMAFTSAISQSTWRRLQSETDLAQLVMGRIKMWSLHICGWLDSNRFDVCLSSIGSQGIHIS